MELPSIKFNIFKKLEYFLVIKEFDKQFEVQFKLLKSKKWDKGNSVFQATYPSWEIEKKILFWSYIYHKHLGRPIREGYFDDMFISKDERTHIKSSKIFENLELRGFGEKEDSGEGFYFNEKGLAFIVF